MNASLHALEFERLKTLLSRYVSTEDAKLLLDRAAPSTHLAELETEHALVAEAMVRSTVFHPFEPDMGLGLAPEHHTGPVAFGAVEVSKNRKWSAVTRHEVQGVEDEGVQVQV